MTLALGGVLVISNPASAWSGDIIDTDTTVSILKYENSTIDKILDKLEWLISAQDRLEDIWDLITKDIPEFFVDMILGIIDFIVGIFTGILDAISRLNYRLFMQFTRGVGISITTWNFLMTIGTIAFEFAILNILVRILGWVNVIVPT